MAGDVDQDAGPYDRVRVRRRELIRPPDGRRVFATREAQQRLQDKERPRWALVAYAIFLLAILIIFAITYTTYAFSRYRGEVLPGVTLDGRALAGMSESQATRFLNNQLVTIYNNPVRLVYGTKRWTPSADGIGYQPDVKATVKAAEEVGRQESFVEQLIDRLPIHPDHPIPLLYRIKDVQLTAFIQRRIAGPIFSAPVNASLVVDKTDHVVLASSKRGVVLDAAATIRAVHNALGALTTQTKVLPVRRIRPAITNGYAMSIRNRVERFLSNPPVVQMGRAVIVMKRTDLAPMISFKDQVGPKQASIIMLVDPNAVQAYVARLAASGIDRPAQNAKIDFAGNHIRVLQPRRTGRTLDQAGAVQKLLAVFNALRPHARLRFSVAVTQPPIDLQNPASVGINTLLGEGDSSFAGAGAGRLADIQTIAARLNDDLIPPDQLISFNQLAGSGLPDAVYADQEKQVNGQLVPGRGGAMQQMATTFLRALYKSGLAVKERHSHPYRLDWYEPPVGLDAVVDPGKNEDLVFKNNTGKYLLITTRVEPVRKEVYVYVYGPKLGWKVAVDPLGKITLVYPHGSDVVKVDLSLAPDETRQIAWAHDGADTDVVRTIEYPNGNVKTDHITSHYQPWRAIILVGAVPTSTPAAKSGKATPTPGPSPTPTYNH